MVTTMTWDGMTERGSGWWPRWAAVVHGGVVGALLAGLAALWATLALTVAMLVTPMETIQVVERHGIWGVGTALRQGNAVLVSAVAPTRERTR
jgi:hypothetical protein